MLCNAPNVRIVFVQIINALIFYSGVLTWIVDRFSAATAGMGLDVMTASAVSALVVILT